MKVDNYIPIIEERPNRTYQIIEYQNFSEKTELLLMQKSIEENFVSHYSKELQEIHKYLFPKITDNEWLEIFPEAKKIIQEQIKEFEIIKEQSTSKIRTALDLIKNKSNPENLWFWQDVLKYTFTPVSDLAIADRNIKRFKSLVTKKGRQGKNNWEALLANARGRDLIDIVESYGIRLRKTGGTYQALCPGHNEKTPSFCIYPPSRFYCFGCGIKGDVIAFVQMMDKCSFKEAINKLQNI